MRDMIYWQMEHYKSKSKERDFVYILKIYQIILRNIYFMIMYTF